MNNIDDLLSFLRNTIGIHNVRLLKKIHKAKDDPNWEDRYIKLLEEAGNYMQAHGEQLVTDSEEYLNVVNAIQAFNGYDDGENEVEEEEEETDEIKINFDDSNIGITNGLNDKYDSLILPPDEQLFPNDIFGQDYNYLDSIGLSNYLQEAFEYTHARKQPGYKRNQLDNDADAKLEELHKIVMRIKAKLSRNENINKEKGELQNIKSYFNRLVRIRLHKEPNQYTIPKVFTPRKETMSFEPEPEIYDANQSMFLNDDTMRTVQFEDLAAELGNQNVNLPNKAAQVNSFLQTNEQEAIRNAYNAARNKSKRPDRSYGDIKAHVDAFKNLNISKQIDTGKFKKVLLDLIINGNYRIKFIPGAATRDLAREYCKKHLDAEGVPLYRLLPVNAQDPIGNPITDLNGDQVDDIVLVNKKGEPSIVNGYKLVFASPYKKVWQSIYKNKQARLAKPFNVWMNEMFQKSVENVNWDEGKYIMEANQTMKDLTAAYTEKGLPKPKVSKRLTPNSFWASTFSHIWADFWNHLPRLKPLKKLFKYLQVANTIYIMGFDSIAKTDIERDIFSGTQLSYEEWVLYKKGHMKEYNRAVSKNLTEIRQIVESFIDISTNQRQSDPNPNGQEGSPDRRFLRVLYELESVIFIVGLEYNPKTDMQKIINLSNKIDLLPPRQLKGIKDQIADRIDNYIETYLYGEGSDYLKFKAERKQAKEAKEDAADQYNILFEQTTEPGQIHQGLPSNSL